MGRRNVCRRIAILCAVVSIPYISVAQNFRLSNRLGYSAELMAEGFGKDLSFVSLDYAVRLTINPSISVTVPFNITELLYNKTSVQNYKFATKVGAGVSINYPFASEDKIAIEAAILSSIEKKSESYWQLRIMGEYVMMQSISCGTILGIGLEYISPYESPSFLAGIYPIISMGILL